MCIGVWTLEHPDFALILCTNRDEYLRRPTQDAHFHSFQDDHSHRDTSLGSGNILSGRDVRAGGSWLGLNKDGRVSLLTNITEAPNSFSSSRGSLVSSFLLSDSSRPLEDEIGKIVPQDAEFAGFNLLLLTPAPPSAFVSPKEIDTSGGHERKPQGKTEETLAHSRRGKLTYDVMFVTNHGAGGRLQARHLTPPERACGCMSNGVDGQGGDKWPKVVKATRDFDAVLKASPVCRPQTSSENELIENLFSLLTWQSPDSITQRSELRNTIQVLPVPISLVPDGTNVPGATPLCCLPGTASATTPPPAPPAEALPTNKPRVQPVSPAASGYEHCYGTRLSTVLLIRRDGSVKFIERDIWRLGQNGKLALGNNGCRSDNDVMQRVFEFQLDLNSSA